MLRDLEQRLIERYQSVIPAGRIIGMVHGTARLLHAAGITGPPLGEQVDVACTAVLNADPRVQRADASSQAMPSVR